MKDIGYFLLGTWLTLTGLHAVIGLRFFQFHYVLGVLAIVAGIFVLLRR